MIVLQTPGVREYRETIQRSVILKELNTILPSDRVLKALARFDPFPSITGPAIDVPAAARLGRARSRRRGGGPVGRARAVATPAGSGVAGSGWVAGAGIVVTNAHVVAGSDNTHVEPNGSGDRLDATAIAFDSRNDVAVLRVPSLDRPGAAFLARGQAHRAGRGARLPAQRPVQDPPGARRRHRAGARQQRLRDAPRAARP